MSQRAFLIAFAMLTGFVLLCTTEAVGAMIGFFTGITIALFAAPLVYAAHAGLNSAGVAVSATGAETILLACAVLLLLSFAVGALWAWQFRPCPAAGVQDAGARQPSLGGLALAERAGPGVAVIALNPYAGPALGPTA